MADVDELIGAVSPSEVAKLISEFNLMAYRLESMEKKLDESLDKLSNKIDQLIEKASETKEKQALDSQILTSTAEEVSKLDHRVLLLEKDVVGVRITMAKLMALGGVGGGLVAGLFKLLEIAFTG
jgi:methyl-accepting chemotaxis protein